MLDPEKEQQRNERAVKLFGVKETIVEENAIQETKPNLPAQQKSLDDFIELAITNNTGSDQLKSLLDMKIQYDQEEARKDFMRALAMFQGECPEITQKSVVDFTSQKGRTSYSYADLKQLTKTIRPFAKECGLAWRWDLKEAEGSISAGCIISHESGYSNEPVWVSMPHDHSGNKDDLKAKRSAIKYAQRASLELALGLSTQDMDDDGDAAAGQLAELIDPSEVDIIRDMIRLAGRSEEKFLALIKIDSLEQLTRPVYDHWHKKLSESYTKGQK